MRPLHPKQVEAREFIKYAPAHPGSEDCLYLQAKVFIQSENCALNTHNECYFYWIFLVESVQNQKRVRSE